MNKLQDWKTNLTRKQRVILLIVVAVVVLALLTATVFRDNVVSFFSLGNLLSAERQFFPQRPIQQPFYGAGR